ncbi:MAG: hypothetical protein Q7R97_02555 [Candidatus Daviesbacteria bacterium]|nr:hypothetical protein [Candidatus Daviesbacteria bacterium]
MAYTQTNSKGTKYYLHGKDVKLRSGRTQRIYYFAKDERAEALNEVPAGFSVVENSKTGLLVLKRI